MSPIRSHCVLLHPPGPALNPSSSIPVFTVSSNDPTDDPLPTPPICHVFQQHPNLSIFHPSESGTLQPSPPPSPSVHSKRDMFKRMSRGASKDNGHDADSQLPLHLRLSNSPRLFLRGQTIHPTIPIVNVAVECLEILMLMTLSGSQLSLNISSLALAGPEPS